MITDRDRIYQAAQKYLQKGQLDRAIAEYESLVQDDPSDLRALLKVGDLQLRLGNVPTATAAYLRVAQRYAADGFFLKAAAVYKQIFNVDPNNVEVGEALAALYQQLNLVGEATAQYRALAQAHDQAGRTDAALAALERAMGDGEAVADDVVAQWAKLKARAGDRPAALARLETLAKAHHDAGRLDAWARIGEQMLALDEALAGLACALARHYMDQGDARAALLKLRLAFGAAPQDDETLALLARAFEALGQTSKAVAVLHELAGQARQRGQVHVRLRVLKQIVALDPTDADAAAALARVEEDVQARRHGRATQRVAPPPTGPEAASAPVTTEADLAKLTLEATIFHRYGLHRRALDVLQRILAAVPQHAEARTLQQAYEAELAALQPTGQAATSPPPSEVEAAVQAGFFAAESTAADDDAAAARPRPAATVVQAAGAPPSVAAPSPNSAPDDAAPASFHFDDEALDVDALIAAAIPQPAHAAAAQTREALAALGSDNGPGSAAAAPTDPRTHFELGVAYRDMGLYDEAIDQFVRAQEDPQRRAEALHGAGLCHLAANRPAEAVRLLQAALAATDPEASLGLAVTYALGLAERLAGHEADAQAHLQRLAEASPSYRDVGLLLQAERPAAAERDAVAALVGGAPQP